MVRNKSVPILLSPFSMQRIARGEAVPEDFDRVDEDQWDLWGTLPATLVCMGLPPNL